MAGISSYYEILGVTHRATPEEVNIAFNRQLKRFPELARDPESNPAFRKLLISYKVLSDSDKRSAYDQTLGTSQISASKALNVQLFASQTVLPAIDEPQVLYLLLDISSAPTVTKKEAAMNICLVIDRSTSMSGPRMNQVKEAATRLIAALRPEDAFSLVTFSDHAEVVIPASPVSNQAILKSRVSQISTGGATEIQKGLHLGFLELSKTRKLSGVSHLILLTDGHTYGDEEECIELAKQAHSKGIGTSAIGIGHEWNDTFLDALVAPSGGSAVYLESPKHIVEHLRRRIKALYRTYAQDVRLRVHLPAKITARAIHKLSPVPSPVGTGQTMVLGTLQYNVPISVLMELIVDPHPPSSSTSLRTSISADIVPTGERSQHFVNQLGLSFSLSAPQEPPLPAVIRAVNKLNLHMLNEKAWEEAEKGEADEASRRLERLGTHLLRSGQTKLAHTAFNEAMNIARTGHLSPEGRKKLKYGTRALIGS